MILDTNVLLYAIGAEHPLKTPARRIVEAVRTGTLTATTSVLVVQEFTYAYQRRHGSHRAVAMARAYVELLEPLLAVDQAHLSRAFDLVESADLRPTDALLAAAALHESHALVSVDRAFSRVPGLRLVSLDQQNIDRLLTT